MRLLWPNFLRAFLNTTIGYEMGPGFAQHVAGLKGTETKSLADLVEFNRKFPEPSYSEGKYWTRRIK